MAAGSGVRIGDAERERVATSLREHYAHGRLTLEEFQQRLDAAFAAKTDTDLARVTADLPHADPYAPPWPPSQPFSAPASNYPVGAATGRGYQRRCGKPFSYVWACVTLCVIAGLLIASFSWPFAAPKIVIILLAILTMFRRIFRRIGGRRR